MRILKTLLPILSASVCCPLILSFVSCKKAPEQVANPLEKKEVVQASLAAASREILFNRDIRPILNTSCTGCQPPFPLARTALQCILRPKLKANF